MLVKYWNLAFFMVLLLTWQIDLGSTYRTKIDQSSNNLGYSSILCLHDPGGPCCMKCAQHMASSRTVLCRGKRSCQERHRETSPAGGRAGSHPSCYAHHRMCARRLMGDTDSHTLMPSSLFAWVPLDEFTEASPGDLTNPGIVPRSPALQADSLPTEPPGKAFTEAKCVRSFCMDLGICTFYLVLVALSLLNHFWNYKMTDCLVEPGSLHNPYLNFFLDYSGILFFWITLEEFTKLKNTHTQNQFNWILS